MDYHPDWKRHVGKVAATAQFFCVDMTAQQVTDALGVEPTDAQTAQERIGGLQGAREATLWRYDSSCKITSSDLNEHLKHLMDVFLPLKSRIEEFRPLPHISISIYWESTVAGVAGPQINAQCVSGLAALGATLHITVAKIDKVEDG
jgi:hypothetical protein